MTTESTTEELLRGEVGTLADVWAASRAQIAERLTSGVIGPSTATFSYAVITALEAYIAEEKQHLADAAVLVTLASHLMTLVQGSTDMHADKPSPMGLAYANAAIDVTRRIANRGRSPTEASFDDFIGKPNEPPKVLQ